MIHLDVFWRVYRPILDVFQVPHCSRRQRTSLGFGIEVVLYCQLQLSRSMWKFFQVDPAWWLVFTIWEGHLSILQNRFSRKCTKVFFCAVSGPWDPSEGPWGPYIISKFRPLRWWIVHWRKSTHTACHPPYCTHLSMIILEPETTKSLKLLFHYFHPFFSLLFRVPDGMVRLRYVKSICQWGKYVYALSEAEVDVAQLLEALG